MVLGVGCLEMLINLIPLCEIGTLLLAGKPALLCVHYVSVTTETQAVKLISPPTASEPLLPFLRDSAASTQTPWGDQALSPMAPSLPAPRALTHIHPVTKCHDSASRLAPDAEHVSAVSSPLLSPAPAPLSLVL